MANFGGGGYGEGGYGGSLPYYLGLLTSQYQNCPKLISWLSTLLQPFLDAYELVTSEYWFFELDNAQGVQLDTLGQLIGAGRVVGFQPSGGVSPVLDDATYRILLKAKIAQNQWDGQLSSLYSIWSALFPGGIIYFVDNQNMTATIVLAGAFTSIIQDLIVNGLIIPRPEAVLYNFTFSTLPIFGFDQDNSFVAGFDKGHMA